MTRIGLLTPYDGSNLGDGTIQTAVIENLRRRDPALELLGITLDPQDTTSRHNIPAFSITGLAVPSYSEALLLRERPRPAAPIQAQTVEAATPPTRPPTRGLRQTLKAIPLVGPTLRFLLRSGQSLRRFIPELRHLRQSYEVVRGLDLLVVSGGGQLDEEFGGPWGHPYVLFRWAMLARLARTPVAFASVGAGYMQRPLTRFFLRPALASARYRSFRDPGSIQRLARWPFTQHDPCVPDLAFGLAVASTRRVRRAGEPLVVGVSPMIYGHAKHWPTARQEVYEGYARRLAEFAHWLLERGHTLVLLRSSSADRVAVAELKARLLGRAGPGVAGRILEPDVQTVQQFFREVAVADCIVASRLHGVLMSHMLGKPTLAISFDRKVDAHMESMAQTEYRVDISEFKVADLIERFTALERNAAAVSEQIADRVARFRADLDTQFDALLTLAGGRPGSAGRGALGGGGHG